MKHKKQIGHNVAYRFDAPIRIVRYRPSGMDIMFYAALFGVFVTAVIFLLFFYQGKFQPHLTIARVLVSIPLILVALLLQSLLRELRVYTKKLLKKSVWTIEELMALTGKNREQTERIITRVLESSFTVDEKCLQHTSESVAFGQAKETPEIEPKQKKEESTTWKS